MAKNSYYYKAFGLIIASAIELPELRPTVGPPDVTIDLGKVPDFLGQPTRIGACYQSHPNQFLYRFDGIAKYLVLEGKKIIIERANGAEARSVRTFLLGSILAALLHQRHILPLHGSAIQRNGNSVILSGLSGSGKSTTTWALIKRGYQMQADDVSAITLDKKGIPMVYPEYPRLRLWKDVLDHEGQSTEPSQRVRRVLEKFAICTEDQFNYEPLPLEKIYILVPYNKKEIKLSSIQGLAKFHRLKRLIYRHKFTQGLETEASSFKTAAQVCEKIPFTLVKRPMHPLLINELADRLENDFNGPNDDE